MTPRGYRPARVSRTRAIVRSANAVADHSIDGFLQTILPRTHHQLGLLRLEQFDQRQREDHQAIWNFYVGSPALGVDLRGRSAADDIGSMNAGSPTTATAVSKQNGT